MSTDLFKAEAKRLADHLAGTHGIKLKHISVLTAIAALHGARDWNTLIARQKSGFVQRVAAAINGPTRLSVVVELEEMLYDLPANGLSYGLSKDSGAAVEIDDVALCRHTLVVGPNGQGVTVLMEHLLTQQILRGGGALVLDPQADLHLAAVVDQAATKAGRKAEQFTVLPQELAEQAGISVDAYDMLAGDDLTAQVARLLAGIYQQDAKDVDECCAVASITELLTTILESLSAAGERINVARVAQLMMQPQQLLDFSASVAERKPEVASRLDAVLREYIRHTRNGAELDESAFKTAFGQAIARLSQLARQERASRRAARSLDANRLLEENQVAYIGFPAYMPNMSTAFSDVMVEHLVQALHNRLAVLSAQRAWARTSKVSKNRNTEPPFLLVLPWCSSLLSAIALRRLMNFGRAANVALVLHVGSISELEAMGKPAMNDVLMNTRQKVFFRQSAPHAIELSAGCVAAMGAVSNGADGHTERTMLQSRLAQLSLGDAILVADQVVHDLRVRMVRLED